MEAVILVCSVRSRPSAVFMVLLEFLPYAVKMVTTFFLPYTPIYLSPYHQSPLNPYSAKARYKSQLITNLSQLITNLSPPQQTRNPVTLENDKK